MTIQKPKLRLVMLLVGAVFTLALGLTFAVAASQEQAANSTDKSTAPSKAEILQRLVETSLSPNRVGNAEGAPLLILSSGSKEISNTEYRSLVGKVTPSKSLVSFPQVRIQNTTDREIRAFSLLLKNDQTRGVHFFRTSGISLKPQDEFQVISERWVRLENLPSRGDQTGHKPYLSKLMEDPSQQTIFWSSEKMWLIGNSSDIEVRVGSVEFVDGSQWNMPEEVEPAKESRLRSPMPVAFKPASFRDSAALRLTVNRLPSCVCSCGEFCWNAGVCDCHGDCNDRTVWTACRSCVSNCCNAACNSGCNSWNWN